MAITDEKKAMRKALAQRRDGIPIEDRQAFSKIASAHMFDFIYQSKVKSIGVFLSIKSEIDTKPLIDMLVEAGYPVGLPVTGDFATPLTFLAYQGDDKLISAKYNTKEPHPDSPEIIPDFLVVPLLGFDNQYYRMGYGGGHYDATISKLEKIHSIKTIGFAFHAQKIEKVITEPHDRQLDGIITEQGVL